MKPASSVVYLYIIAKTELGDCSHTATPVDANGHVRAETRMGYHLLSRVLRKHYGRTLDVDKIRTMPLGKPYLKGHDFYFNFAHSADFIACAVSDVEVGVDIEQPRTIARNLHGKILTASERSLGVNPLQAWVTKEAYSKYVGSGLAMTYSSVSADTLRREHPSLMKTNKRYLCVLFYADTNSRVKEIFTLNTAGELIL